MAGDMDESGDVEQIARIASELAGVLAAEKVAINLQNGKEIVGPVLGFSLKRKEKKGDVTWSGSVRVQIDSGELEIDFQTIDSVSAK